MAGVEEEDETPAFTLEGNSVFGYQANVFEVNSRFEKPSGDGFWQAYLDATLPLGGEDGFLAVTFGGYTQTFFTLSQIDEYVLQPGLTLTLIDDDATVFTINVHASRFRQRVYAEFENIPGTSEYGTGVGLKAEFEREWEGSRRLIWTGGFDYQFFDSVDQDNFAVVTAGRAEWDLSEDFMWSGGMEWTYQSYENLPPDSVDPGSPPQLQFFQGQVETGLTHKFGHGWIAEVSLGGGASIDTTSNYYTAGLLTARCELRWEQGKWAVGSAFVSEFVWFTARPANLDGDGKTLSTQNYAIEVNLEYTLTEHLTLVASWVGRLQATNANEEAGDATLNSFTDSLVKAGVSVSF